MITVERVYLSGLFTFHLLAPDADIHSIQGPILVDSECDTLEFSCKPVPEFKDKTSVEFFGFVAHAIACPVRICLQVNGAIIVSPSFNLVDYFFYLECDPTGYVTTWSHMKIQVRDRTGKPLNLVNVPIQAYLCTEDGKRTDQGLFITGNAFGTRASPEDSGAFILRENKQTKAFAYRINEVTKRHSRRFRIEITCSDPTLGIGAAISAPITVLTKPSVKASGPSQGVRPVVAEEMRDAEFSLFDGVDMDKIDIDMSLFDVLCEDGMGAPETFGI